jgi:hypothetical protein
VSMALEAYPPEAHAGGVPPGIVILTSKSIID